MADDPGDSFEALHQRALEQQALGHHGEAADAYRAMVAAVTSQLAVLQFNLGAALAEAGQLDEAARAYGAALVARPGWALALDNLGTVCHRQGRTDDAIAAFRAAVTAAPDRGGAHYNLGAQLCATGDHAGAEAAFRAALAVTPGLAHIEEGLGLALAAQGRVDDAVAAYRRAVELDPDPLAAQLQVARLLLRAGQPAAALATAEQACARHPDDPVAHGVRGAALTGLGRHEAAAGAHDRARTLAPERFEAHFNCGLAAEALDDLPGAAAAYRAAIAHDPRRLEALNNLARMLIDLGRNDELLGVYQQLREVDPGNPRVGHLITALRGELTAGCPPAYVVDEFDRLSERFDQHLVGQLGYRAPERVGALVANARPGGQRFAACLDLGCGTGLAGVQLRPLVDRLDGVDLSPKMIALARAKGVYDQLTVAELVGFLEGPTGQPRYDLITATDVLIYLGDLQPVFAATRRRLGSGGLFVFTVEHDETADIGLPPTGRFTHARGYLDRLAATHRFTVVHCERGALRREANDTVMGLTYCLRATDE